MDTTEFRSDLGSRIRLARHGRGLTQLALAELVKLYHSDISCIERGLRATVDARVVVAIATALEVDPGWLLTGHLEPCIAHHANTHRLLEMAAHGHPETGHAELRPSA